MKSLLEIEDLIAGLMLFGRDRYHAVEVFADDLSKTALEGVQAEPVIKRDGRAFRFTVFEDRGVVRLEALDAANVREVAALGAALGVAVSAARREKGEGMIGGALLGMLIGGLIGAASEGNKPRRVFAMKFDPARREWMAYDGALLRWMKDRLLVLPQAESEAS